MAVSSNSLFHYTDNLETLKSIIKEGFLLSYCLENSMAIPMISFCDNPLSQAKYFLDNYGNYAIGMNIDWGIKNKLNPVVYLEEKSYLSETLELAMNSMGFLHEYVDQKLDFKKRKEVKQVFSLQNFPMEITRFSKPYRGKLVRNGTSIENYKFYDEREWRYIPDSKQTYFPLGLIEPDYEEFKKENPTKPHFKENGLKFKANDIKYIIIKNKNEVPNLIDFLMNLDNLGTPQDIQLLFTRILLAEQIIEDI
ncbi:MAG: abortive infection system antitoxin AbiGi family protein [Gillisia sp.]